MNLSNICGDYGHIMLDLRGNASMYFHIKTKKNVVVCIIKPIWQVVIKREVLESHVLTV